MLRAIFIFFFLGVAMFAASGDTQQSDFDLGSDRFMAGNDIVQDKDNVDDLFMAGAAVASAKDIGGSAHMIGRKVISNGTIGGDAYLTGMDVTIAGIVTGDTTVAAGNIDTGEIGGDLRATGQNITVSGPVAGYALIAGEEVVLNSTIAGDVNMAADDVSFGEAARIDGKLVLYEEEPGDIVIPTAVISEDRVERRDMADWSEDVAEAESESVGSRVFKFFKRLVFIVVLVSAIAAVRPKKLTALRSDILSHPLRNILFGFLAVSLILGASIIWMFTGLSFLLVLVAVFTLVVAIFTGYVLGAYAVGAKTLQWVNRPVSETLGGHTLTALVGALIVSIIALIPYLGWAIVFAVLMAGLGSLAVRLVRPFKIKEV